MTRKKKKKDGNWNDKVLSKRSTNVDKFYLGTSNICDLILVDSTVRHSATIVGAKGPVKWESLLK